MNGKVGAITYARENKIPLLGLCLGLQCIVIEAARNLADIPDANSTEFDAATAHPVISTMAEQLDIVEGEGDLGGTMRLGMYPAKLAEGSIVREVYDDQPYVEERHRHRYEVNNAYRAELEKKAGHASSPAPRPDNKLVEYVEYPREVHPYLVATQAHPELRSRPTRPHPLFAGLVKAAVERKTRQVDGRHARAVRLTGVRVLHGMRTPVSRCASWEDSRHDDQGHPRGVAGHARPRRRSWATRPASAPTTWSCPTARSSRRDYQVHPGSVAVLALDDAGPGPACSRQYRHPVRHKLWEIPAGLLDVPGENPLHAAQRELYEEAHVKAEDWRVLADVYTTPGGCDEAVRIFLARDLSEAEGERFEVSEEEADMELARVPLDELVRGVLAGRAAQQLPGRGRPRAGRRAERATAWTRCARPRRRGRPGPSRPDRRCTAPRPCRS